MIPELGSSYHSHFGKYSAVAFVANTPHTRSHLPSAARATMRPCRPVSAAPACCHVGLNLLTRVNEGPAP